MSIALWFPRITHLDGVTGTPTTLIDFTVNTSFQITDHRLQLLRQQPWVEQANRRRRDLGVQLIVRVGDLPSRFAAAGSTEAFRAHLLTLLRGW